MVILQFAPSMAKYGLCNYCTKRSNYVICVTQYFPHGVIYIAYFVLHGVEELDKDKKHKYGIRTKHKTQSVSLFITILHDCVHMEHIIPYNFTTIPQLHYLSG